jgi:hypothetical protein
MRVKPGRLLGIHCSHLFDSADHQADGDLEGVIEGFRAALDRESAQAVSAVASVL